MLRLSRDWCFWEVAQHFWRPDYSLAQLLTMRMRREISLSISGLDAFIEAPLASLLEEGVLRAYPGNDSPVRSALRGALLLDERQEFISYWGIGDRSAPSSKEVAALSFLEAAIRQLSRALDLEWSLEILLTDTHARINGKGEEVIQEYSINTLRLLKEHGIRGHLLSELLEAEGLDPSLTMGTTEEIHKGWLLLRSQRKRELVRLASVHSRGSRPEQAAELYYRSNLIEASVLAKLRPKSIFLTYMVPSMAYLLPPLPLLHLYVGPDRLVKRPWFDVGLD